MCPRPGYPPRPAPPLPTGWTTGLPSSGRETGGRDLLQLSDHELRRISLDVVGRCEHDELDPASKLLLRRVTERAIAETLDPLAAGFAAALARGIEGLPPELRYRLTLAEERRDIGWD